MVSDSSSGSWVSPGWSPVSAVPVSSASASSDPVASVPVSAVSVSSVPACSGSGSSGVTVSGACPSSCGWRDSSVRPVCSYWPGGVISSSVARAAGNMVSSRASAHRVERSFLNPFFMMPAS